MPRGEYLQYGGQAIVEGVMMRSPRFFSVACRAPNGEIVIETEAIEATWVGRQKWLKKPFLRGSLALLDAMALGIRAMRFAANVQVDSRFQDPNDAPAEPTVPKSPARQMVEGVLLLLVGLAGVAIGTGKLSVGVPDGATKVALVVGIFAALTGLSSLSSAFRKEPVNPDRVQDVAIGGTMVVSLGFGLFLFNYLPNFAAENLQRTIHNSDYRLTNLVAELVKIGVFLGYIGLIGLIPDIRRVFQYHGAEHKAINTLEAEQSLDIENCRAQTRLHPRCGTSFAIIVLILGLLLFTFVPRYPVTGQPGNVVLDTSVRFVIELALLPFISGTAYELLRLAGKFRDQRWVNMAFKPGIWSQYLTTREPDGEQIEVALAALKACIDAEDGVDSTKVPESNALESAPPTISS